MGRGLGDMVMGALHRTVVRQWSGVAEAADGADPAALRATRSRAVQLRRTLDEAIHAVEGRLALPLGETDGIRRPPGTDWAWRPEVWRGPLSPPGRAAVESGTKLGHEATLFHDCRISELTLRQVRMTRAEDIAPYGLRLDVFRFDGSFLSLVLDLPAAAVEGLTRTHVLAVEARIETENPLEIFTRLNVRHGPNTEQVVRELPLGQSEVEADFDLAYTRMNEKRVERMWLDLIFEGPEMNQITIRDLTLTRRPRAAL